MTGLSPTPEPPYWAVVFTSQRTVDDPDGYAAMAAAMSERARAQPGYLGHESARGADGVGITVSYWATEEALRAWKRAADHVGAQHLGRERWYADYTVRIARVERAYTAASSPVDGLDE